MPLPRLRDQSPPSSVRSVPTSEEEKEKEKEGGPSEGGPSKEGGPSEEGDEKKEKATNEKEVKGHDERREKKIAHRRAKARARCERVSESTSRHVSFWLAFCRLYSTGTLYGFNTN